MFQMLISIIFTEFFEMWHFIFSKYIICKTNYGKMAHLGGSECVNDYVYSEESLSPFPTSQIV